MPSLTPFASASASSSRTPLRSRHDASDAEAISAGAYLARPISARRTGDAGHGRKGKGKERESLIPGYRIGSRGWVREAFRLFGEHCARNQIRTLLIDCLVMTNLFYPALSTYLQRRFPPLHPPSTPSHETHRSSYWRSPTAHSACRRRRKKEHPLSLLSTPVLDSFFPYPPPLLPRLDWGGWWTDTGQDEWTGARVRTSEDDEEIRLVRIGWADVGEVLDRDEETEDYTWTERDYDVLDLVRHTVETWIEEHGNTGEGCIRQLREDTDEVRPSGDCYLFSHVEVPGLTSTSSLFSHNCSHHAELTYDNDDGRVYRSVAALFRIPASSPSDSFDARWAAAMDRIAQKVDAEVFAEAERPHRNPTETIDAYHLSDPDAKDDGAASAIDGATPKSVLFLYLVLFCILGHQLSGATKVHSRFGLAFTGIVQLCCSAVMSFSVLALLGWNGWGWGAGNETTLPTYVLPFVIVVVGAENMSTLTKAVFSVPFSHSVPVRIGLGLSKVGTTIALTSLTDLVLLLGIWLCVNLRPVREFCLFAAVVIITDWFMLHTFFLTVLSIDAQRLELADVLASNGGITEAPRPKDDEAHQRSPAENGWKKMIRARTSKSGSLLFILICVGVIYYLTERHRLPLSTPSLYGYNPTPTGHATTTSQAVVTTASDLKILSIAERLWRSINPLGLTHVTAIVPPASILVLPRIGHHMRPADLRKLSLPTSRIILPRLKPLFYVFKVVVLPQAATAGTLYAILLFLLKDADLLDAQRNRLGRNEEPRDTDDEDGNGGKGRGLKGVQVHLLPCSHEADVDIVASSDDGKVVVSVGIDNTLCLWRLSDVVGTGTRESLRSELLSNAEAVLDAAISGDGTIVAALLDGGSLLRWRTEDGAQPVALSTVSLPPESETARFVETRKSDDPFLSRPSSPHHEDGEHELLLTGSNGSVHSVTSTGQIEAIVPPKPSARWWILESRPGSTSDIALLSSTPTEVTLYRRSDAGWYPTIVPASTSSRVSAAALTSSTIALGYRSGLVELFDLDGSLLLSITGSSASSPTSSGRSVDGIKHLALAIPPHSACTTCGLVSSDSMFVISSTAERVTIDRVNPRGSIPCRCRRGSVLDDNKYPSSISGSNDSPSRLVIPPTGFRGGFSPGASPKKSPSLLPPVSGDIPLSYHGGRRLSALHRDEASPGLGMTGLSVTPTSPDSDTEVLPLGAVLVPSGGAAWTVSGDLLLGLRRFGGGIDDAQWEMWAVDLRAPWNGSSLVVDAAPLTALLHRATTAPNTTVRAQRAERLLSLNGRAPFPSLGASFSVDTFSPLAYTEIRPFHAVSASVGSRATGLEEPKMGKVVIGLGNRMGVVSIPSPREKKRATSGQAGSSGVGLGIASLGVTGLGITPPPPSARRSVGEESKKLL